MSLTHAEIMDRIRNPEVRGAYRKRPTVIQPIPLAVPDELPPMVGSAEPPPPSASEILFRNRVRSAVAQLRDGVPRQEVWEQHGKFVLRAAEFEIERIDSLKKGVAR